MISSNFVGRVLRRAAIAGGVMMLALFRAAATAEAETVLVILVPDHQVDGRRILVGSVADRRGGTIDLRIDGQLEMIKKKDIQAQYSDSAAAYQAAREHLNPRNWQHHAELADICEKLGLHAEARQEWRSAYDMRLEAQRGDPSSDMEALFAWGLEHGILEVIEDRRAHRQAEREKAAPEVSFPETAEEIIRELKDLHEKYNRTLAIPKSPSEPEGRVGQGYNAATGVSLWKSTASGGFNASLDDGSVRELSGRYVVETSDWTPFRFTEDGEVIVGTIRRGFRIHVVSDWTVKDVFMKGGRSPGPLVGLMWGPTRKLAVTGGRGRFDAWDLTTESRVEGFPEKTSSDVRGLHRGFAAIPNSDEFLVLEDPAGSGSTPCVARGNLQEGIISRVRLPGDSRPVEVWRFPSLPDDAGPGNYPPGVFDRSMSTRPSFSPRGLVVSSDGRYAMANLSPAAAFIDYSNRKNPMIRILAPPEKEGSGYGLVHCLFTGSQNRYICLTNEGEYFLVDCTTHDIVAQGKLSASEDQVYYLRDDCVWVRRDGVLEVSCRRDRPSFSNPRTRAVLRRRALLPSGVQWYQTLAERCLAMAEQCEKLDMPDQWAATAYYLAAALSPTSAGTAEALAHLNARPSLGAALAALSLHRPHGYVSRFMERAELPALAFDPGAFAPGWQELKAAVFTLDDAPAPWSSTVELSDWCVSAAQRLGIQGRVIPQYRLMEIALEIHGQNQPAKDFFAPLPAHTEKCKVVVDNYALGQDCELFLDDVRVAEAAPGSLVKVEVASGFHRIKVRAGGELITDVRVRMKWPTKYMINPRALNRYTTRLQTYTPGGLPAFQPPLIQSTGIPYDCEVFGYGHTYDPDENFPKTITVTVTEAEGALAQRTLAKLARLPPRRAQ